MYFLYILECQNGAYYTGITTDPERRWAEHTAGKAAKYTRAFPPEKMVALWEIGQSRAFAQQLEARMKSLSKVEKLALVDHPITINTLNKFSDLTLKNNVVPRKLIQIEKKPQVKENKQVCHQ